MSYTHMVIGEALNEEQLKEFEKIFKSEVAPALKEEKGFVFGHMMLEEDGYMAVILTRWETRQDCIRYHSGRSYRQMVSKTQHLLAGNFVVKIFRDSE